MDSRRPPLKLIFRLNYHTRPGQSLWLKYSVILDPNGVRFDQVVPMRWLNDRQWEAVVDIRGSGRLRIEYSYLLRRETEGVDLDEWQPAREVALDLEALDAMVLQDDWRSAGTVDHVFESKAFRSVPREGGGFGEPPVPAGADHTFRIRIAGVPAGKVPCLSGSVKGLGNWGWHSAVPLREVEPDVWQASVPLPADWEIDYKYGFFDPKIGCIVSLELGENRKLRPHQAGGRQWTHVSDECYRRGTEGFFRGAGVAIPVFSLRGEKSFGVGEFADLKPLADWAAEAGLKLIQILPVNDTTSAHDWTDSYPYSAISVFALHPIYLRLDDLGRAMPAKFQQEIAAGRERLNALPHLDHEAVMGEKLRLTRMIFEKHSAAILKDAGFREFVAENRDWLLPYAAFCVKRDRFGTADFTRWEDGWAEYDPEKVEELADPGHAEWPDVAYFMWLQWELDRQFIDAAAHLHARGVVLKGDLPIGIDRLSADAWSAPHLFKMDAQAGAPPDAFAVKGQNWGFPTYDWEVMRGDGYTWWRSRFAHLSRYFDAFRIDHILGFFRIWQVPAAHVEGIMGMFDPALPVRIEEFAERGIEFDYNRFCRPYIRWDALVERFGDAAEYVKHAFLHDCEDGYFQLREEVLTQRRIEDHFARYPHDPFISQGLMDCVSEVLFFEVPGSHGKEFHPRMSMQATHSFRDLDPDQRWRVEELYNDFFFRRQEEFWEARAYEKLPAMRRASDMLLCGEDLGMVPACVPGVLKELGILSLEIQRMPKTHETEFFNLQHAPYMSVVSPSTHDMSTLRGWWKEDPEATARYAWRMLGITFPEVELSGEVAGRIVGQHLHSPAMWAIFPLQDLLAMDETLRHPVAEDERINVPAIIPFNWRYRMHLDLTTLAAAAPFNGKLRRMIQAAGR